MQSCCSYRHRIRHAAQGRSEQLPSQDGMFRTPPRSLREERSSPTLTKLSSGTPTPVGTPQSWSNLRGAPDQVRERVAALWTPRGNCGPLLAMDPRHLGPVLLLVVLVVVVVARLRYVHPYVKQMQAEDGDDPLLRWARGCWAITFGPVGAEIRDASSCREFLRRDWEIGSSEEALATIARLSAVPTGQVAWDLVRTVLVTRLASGAGLLDMEQARAAIARVQGPLRARYSGWEEMANDYDASALERGFTSERRDTYRSGTRVIWKAVRFK